MPEPQSAVPLHLVPDVHGALVRAAFRAAHPFRHIGQRRIPPGESGQRFLAGCPRVPAWASDSQHVLAEVIGQLDDSQWQTRGHHRARILRSAASVVHPVFRVGHYWIGLALLQVSRSRSGAASSVQGARGRQRRGGGSRFRVPLRSAVHAVCAPHGGGLAHGCDQRSGRGHRAELATVPH